MYIYIYICIYICEYLLGEDRDGVLDARQVPPPRLAAAPRRSRAESPAPESPMHTVRIRACSKNPQFKKIWDFPFVLKNENRLRPKPRISRSLRELGVSPLRFSVVHTHTHPTA